MDHSSQRKPAVVGWGITDACNLTCAHCYSSARRGRGDELSTEQAKQVLDQLGALGAQRLGWTGGEPLLRKDLEQLTSYARDRHGISAGLTTNGTPLTARRARSLAAAGISFVQISLDGTSAVRNRRIRGATPLQFDQVMRAIGVAREVGFDVHLAMLLSAATLDDVRSMARLAGTLQVKSLRFCGFVPWGHARAEHVRAQHDLSGHADEVRALITELQGQQSPMVLFDPGFGPLPPDYSFHQCIAGMEMVYIAANGDVFPCTALLHPSFRVGNVRERSLASLWDDPAMTAVARYPRERIAEPCRGCPSFEDCRGGCRGYVVACGLPMDAALPNCLAVGAAC